MSEHEILSKTAHSSDLLVRLATIAHETVIDHHTLTVADPKMYQLEEPRDLEDILRRFYLGEIMSYVPSSPFGSTSEDQQDAMRAASRAIRRALESSHGVDYSTLYDAKDAPVLALDAEMVFRAEDDPGREAVEEILRVLRFSKRVGALNAYVSRIETAIGALTPPKDIDRETILEVREAVHGALKRVATLIEGGMRFDAKPQFMRAEQFLVALRGAVQDELTQWV